MPDAFAIRSPEAADLHRRLTTRTARAGVIGLGYVGHPLAVEFGRAGFEVVGVDVDRGKCDEINSGRSHIGDVPDADVAALVRSGRLCAVTGLGLESTTYPGTTEEVFRTILEQTGLKVGADFFLAFSPERVDPGNQTWNTLNVPKSLALPRSARRWPPNSTGRPSTGWCRSVHPAPLRWSSCWRTHSGPSTSGSPARWR